MNVDVILIAVLAAGVLALLYAFIKTSWIGRQNVSNAALKEIGKHIADGAMAFLKRLCWRFLIRAFYGSSLSRFYWVRAARCWQATSV